MRLDAHQHYWKIERGDYGWITPDVPRLYRDFLPPDLLPHLRKHAIDGTIAVQAAPTTEETMFLLDLAERDETIRAVVGWLDPADPDHRAHYERFAARPKFAGFRVMIQEMPDARAALAPAFVAALREYAEQDVPVDLLVRSHQLETLAELADRVPGLRGVVDHIGKPPIAEGAMEPWRTHMARLAAHPNLRCKLSGMVTEADHAAWTAEQLVPYVREIARLFGPERVLYGSDWPVCLLAATYDEQLDALERALPDDWGEAERARLFGLNAKEFYKL